MKVIKTQVPKPKYALSEKVLVFSKFGLTEAVITRISIDLYKDGETRIMYAVNDRDYDFYLESQIYTKDKAFERLQEGVKQLKLFEAQDYES